jgi:arylsulfatase
MVNRSAKRQCSTAAVLTACFFGLGLIAIAGESGLGGLTAAVGERPNIVNILVDDMGYSDIGCYGGEIHTPNIDFLAKDGLRFSAYRTYPKCFPTRDSILTGVEAPPITRREHTVTIAEVLKDHGYQSFFSGKTHGEFIATMEDVPARGFDRSFGNVNGGNYFDHRLEQCYLDGEKWHTDKPFYKNDVQTDFALEFLELHQQNKKPFFLHLAFHAPHYPVPAKPEDIVRHIGKYHKSPKVFRKERYERLKEMGLIDPQWRLSPPVATENEWKILSDEEKDQSDQVMAVYAAMIDNVDQNIGRLIAKLKDMHLFENTLITFSSDNGACSVGGNGKWPGFIKARMGKTYDPDAPIGSIDSHWQVGPAWANMSETPFRKFKNHCYEGGLSVPLIVHWPSRVRMPGRVSHEHVFVWDLMPTWLEAAGAKYPETIGGRAVRPQVGHSLVPILVGEKVERVQRETFFFHEDTRAFIKGDWKIVADAGKDFDNTQWELFNLRTDRTELNDVASENQEKLAEMVGSLRAYLKANAPMFLADSGGTR